MWGILPLSTRFMALESEQAGVNSQVEHQHGGRFHVECDAREGGCLRTTTNSFSIGAWQQIRRGQEMETWNSVSIISQEEADGSLWLRTIIFHPDWEEPVQIACLRSWPQHVPEEVASLQCDLEHKHL